MSKVYVLYEEPDSNTTNIKGVITKLSTAQNWHDLEFSNAYVEFELDDPELLNRIAKEGK